MGWPEWKKSSWIAEERSSFTSIIKLKMYNLKASLVYLSSPICRWRAHHQLSIFPQQDLENKVGNFQNLQNDICKDKCMQRKVCLLKGRKCQLNKFYSAEFKIESGSIWELLLGWNLVSGGGGLWLKQAIEKNLFIQKYLELSIFFLKLKRTCKEQPKPVRRDARPLCVPPAIALEGAASRSTGAVYREPDGIELHLLHYLCSSFYWELLGMISRKTTSIIFRETFGLISSSDLT